MHRHLPSFVSMVPAEILPLKRSYAVFSIVGTMISSNFLSGIALDFAVLTYTKALWEDVAPSTA